MKIFSKDYLEKNSTARGRFPVDQKRTKYLPGDNCCGNCQASNHKRCRPRLDGTLCSCSCDHAETNRSIHNGECRQAVEKNLPEPTIRESLSPFYPRITGGLYDSKESFK